VPRAPNAAPPKNAQLNRFDRERSRKLAPNYSFHFNLLVVLIRRAESGLLEKFHVMSGVKPYAQNDLKLMLTRQGLPSDIGQV
jgi:hypothetical protein